jgi:hypothetical protein
MTVDQVFTWIEAHVGLMALLTAIASFLLFVEARAARMRSEAIVEAVPDLYGQGMLLVVAVINSGPAVGRDFSLEMTLRHPTDATKTTQHKLDRRALPVGQALLMPRVHGESKYLRELSDEGFILDLRWRWQDERRWFWIGPRGRHSRHETYPTHDFFEGLRQSGFLVSPTTDLDIMLKRNVTKPIEALSQRIGELAAAAEREPPKSAAVQLLAVVRARLAKTGR